MGLFPHENFKSSCDIVENKVAKYVSSTPPKEKQKGKHGKKKRNRNTPPERTPHPSNQDH